ncbi:MAG: leucine-rich repeat protein, partial [Clostridia bacterium]|nr:leucine-rich repeat protein [Clostridia bacterium]
MSLEEVKLPNSVEAIGSYAFGNCENLEKINYPLNWT